jgi:chromosomal replication initiation ATPase DnaA
MWIGTIILLSKTLLERVKTERVLTRDISRGRFLRSTVDIEEIISACCKYFCVTREEMVRNRRGESRKACIYMIRKHTCATNREIAELFGTLTYSAVAKISESVSRQLPVNKNLQEQIKMMEMKYSYFKA